MFESLPLDTFNKTIEIRSIVPASIGKVFWYSTTHEISPTSSEQKSNSIQMCMAIIIILAGWGLFAISIYLPIIFTVIGVIRISLIINKGKGSDYIIGKKGFCAIKFSKFRKKIEDIKTVLFDDVEYLFFGETKIFENKEYNRTEFVCSFYGHSSGTQQVSYPCIYTLSGSYLEDVLKDYTHRLFSSYVFAKELEDVWSKHIISTYGLSESVEFKVVNYALHRNTVVNKLVDNIVKDTGVAYKSLSNKNLRTIILTNNELIIDGTKYNFDSLKYAGIEKGFMVFEHDNHTRRLWGLADNGDTHSIQLNGLTNMKAFLAMLQYRLDNSK